MKKIDGKYKIFILLVGILIIYGIAMLSVSNDEVKDYKIKKCGKEIVIDKNNQNETMDVEEFVPCVVMSVLPIDSEEELIKMQMVITRTFILKQMEDKGSINASELKIDYITYNEMKINWGSKFVDNYNKLQKYAFDTNKQVIKYEDKLIMPYFHVLSAGRTRDGKEVLGDEYTYLESVECKDDLQAKDFLSIEYIPMQEFIDKLKAYNKDIKINIKNFFNRFEITKKCSQEYIMELKIGNVTISGQEFSRLFKLNSTYFSVEKYPGQDEQMIRIVTKGKGDGFGVSLHEANIMAGEGKSFKEILEYYYKNVMIG